MDEKSENLEIILMIASKDRSIRRTHIFKNVEDFSAIIDPPTPEYIREYSNATIERSPLFNNGHAVTIQFNAFRDGDDSHYTKAYDHTVASEELNDLDELLLTFPIGDRLRMAKRYISEKETKLKKFMEKNEDLVVDYLQDQGYSVTREENCERKEHHRGECIC